MESSENVSPSDSERFGPDGESDLEFDPSDSEMVALADAAFRQAAIKLIRRAKQTGDSLILWDQGKVHQQV